MITILLNKGDRIMPQYKIISLEAWLELKDQPEDLEAAVQTIADHNISLAVERWGQLHQGISPTGEVFRGWVVVQRPRDGYAVAIWLQGELIAHYGAGRVGWTGVAGPDWLNGDVEALEELLNEPL